MRLLKACCLVIFVAHSILGPLQLAAKDPKPLSVTFTYGLNGIVRSDTRFVAGETISATVSVRDCQIPESGVCQFAMRYSVVDASGKVIFSNADDEILTRAEAGAFLVKLPLRCELSMLLESGDFEFVLQLRDKRTREIYQSRQPITILPKNEFTISGFGFVANPKSTVPIGTTFETSQLVYINWITCNLQVKDGRCFMEANVRVLDGNQKSIDPPIEPKKGDFSASSNGIINSLVNLSIENPGEYTAEVTVKDLVSGKSETRSIPFRIVESLVDIMPAPLQ